MMDRDGVEAFVREAYRARMAGDLEAVSRLLTPDTTFRLAGVQESFPPAADARGHAAVRQGLDALITAFEYLDLELLDLVVEGDRAATHWRVRLRDTRSGAEHTTEMCDLWTFRDGRISAFVQFCDTALAAELAAKA